MMKGGSSARQEVALYMWRYVVLFLWIDVRVIKELGQNSRRTISI